jgi:putative tricarboxylic transport membrane protein
MKKQDLISGTASLFIGLAFTLGGFRYGFGAWKNPGPGFLAILFGVLLMALSASLLAMTLRGAAEGANMPFWRSKGGWRPVLYSVLSLIVYMLILRKVGFLLTTFLFIFFLLRFVCGKRWVISVAVAVAFSLVSYGLFSVLLGTPLPKGRIYGSSIRVVDRV